MLINLTALLTFDTQRACKNSNAPDLPLARPKMYLAGAAGSIARMLASLLSLLVVVSNHATAQSNDAYARKYFLDEPPTDQSALSVVSSRSEILKVNVLSVTRRGGRHGEGEHDTLFEAGVKIIDPLNSPRKAGTRDTFYFVDQTDPGNVVAPVTPAMRARPYYVAAYRGGRDQTRLVGFPVSKAEYDTWEKEFFEYELVRNRSGARDR